MAPVCFTCTACQQRFNDKQRSPLLLPCGDVFCRHCISSLEDRDNYACPKRGCGKSWSNHSVSDLAIVYDLVPEGTGASGGRDIEPARDGQSGRDIEPNNPLLQDPSGLRRRTGRDIAPVDGSDESDDDTASVARSSTASSEWPSCPVCLDDYNLNANRPVLLPCGHVTCHGCLQVLQENNDLGCPRCRATRSRSALATLPLVNQLVHPSNAGKRGNVMAADILRRARETQRNWQRRGSDNDFDAQKKIEIFVTDVRGQTHTFQVNPNTETVYQLRQRLGRVDSCRYLTFEGRTLQDNQVLANYRVRHHCTLLERGRVQGGSN